MPYQQGGGLLLNDIISYVTLIFRDVTNIIGIKDSSGDFTLTGEYNRLTQGKGFHVLLSRDTFIHACLCYGGMGSSPPAPMWRSGSCLTDMGLLK